MRAYAASTCVYINKCRCRNVWKKLFVACKMGQLTEMSTCLIGSIPAGEISYIRAEKGREAQDLILNEPG